MVSTADAHEIPRLCLVEFILSGVEGLGMTNAKTAWWKIKSRLKRDGFLIEAKFYWLFIEVGAVTTFNSWMMLVAPYTLSMIQST